MWFATVSFAFFRKLPFIQAYGENAWWNMPNRCFSVVGNLLLLALLYASFWSKFTVEHRRVSTMLRAPVSSIPVAQLHLAEDEWQRGLTDSVREIISERSTERGCSEHSRFAMCFFGQVKSIEPNHTRLLMENIITPLLTVASCIDVYLHTYDIHSFTNPRNGESRIELNVRESIEALMAHLRLMSNGKVVFKMIDISDPREADLKFRPLRHYLSRGDPWKNDGVSMFYLLRQLYSLNQVTQMWDTQTTESYSGAVYVRPDLIFQVPLRLSTVVDLNRTLINAKDNTTIYTPGFDVYGGLNDRFAIGHPAVMRAYGRRMQDIEKYFESYPTKTLHSEQFLYNVLVEKRGIQNRSIDNFTFARVRADGRYKSTRC